MIAAGDDAADLVLRDGSTVASPPGPRGCIVRRSATSTNFRRKAA